MKYNVDKTKSTREDSVAEQVHFVRNRERCSSQAKNEKGKIDEEKRGKRERLKESAALRLLSHIRRSRGIFECIY